MRIKDIAMSWFRGASSSVSLKLDGKSMVVYGPNGSGKSSFVDAIEFILNDGKINHLAHEYSGRRQEKGVLNTHIPGGQAARVTVTFLDNSQFKIEWQKTGAYKPSGDDAAAIRAWEYRRTILRQDEVAQFISGTKGDKYSALLPLLGLHSLEVTAENLRQLAKSVEDQSGLKGLKGELSLIQTKRRETFQEDSDMEIGAKIDDLYARYCADNLSEVDSQDKLKVLKPAIASRIAAASADDRRYVALRDISTVTLAKAVEDVRIANGHLAGTVDPVIAEKLELLTSSGLLVQKLNGGGQVDCPVCGRSIEVVRLQEHVAAERTRLQGLIDSFETRKKAIAVLSNLVSSLQMNARKPDVNSWKDDLAQGPFGANIAFLDGFYPDALRITCDEVVLKEIEKNLIPVIKAAVEAAKNAPPDAQQLSIDKMIAEVGADVIGAVPKVTAVKTAESLIEYINDLEQAVREEIRSRTETAITSLSTDVREMWATLHPGEAIEDVRLYLPNDADKAIDVGLKFHGVDQDSPRLTLSEGYRNSLGLCIFLAMAKQDADNDRPIFLDDIIVSLDRNHRGMVAELLKKEFSGRQIIIMTHDRDWYAELRQQLDQAAWRFHTLLPYEIGRAHV